MPQHLSAVQIKAVNLGRFGRSYQDLAFSNYSRAIEPLIIATNELRLRSLVWPKIPHLGRLNFARVAIYPREFAFHDVDRHDRACPSRANENAPGIRWRDSRSPAGRIERDALLQTQQLLLPLDLTGGRVQRNQVQRAPNFGHDIQRVVDRQWRAEEKRPGEFAGVAAAIEFPGELALRGDVVRRKLIGRSGVFNDITIHELRLPSHSAFVFARDR